MPDEPESISKDDLESLQFLFGEFEKAQYAVRSFQRHIAAKYKLKNDASIDLNGGGKIVRTAKVDESAAAAADPPAADDPA